MDERQLENLAVSLKTPSFVFDTDILKAAGSPCGGEGKAGKALFCH